MILGSLAVLDVAGAAVRSRLSHAREVKAMQFRQDPDGETLITVEQNTHALTVHAVDEAGNVADVTLALLVDKSDPVIAFSEGVVRLDARDLHKFLRDAVIDIAATALDAESGLLSAADYQEQISA